MYQITKINDWPIDRCKIYIYIYIYLVVPGLMEKAVATHSSTLASKIPWMEEPAGLQSIGSLRVGHD